MEPTHIPRSVSLPSPHQLLRTAIDTPRDWHVASIHLSNDSKSELAGASEAISTGRCLSGRNSRHFRHLLDVTCFGLPHAGQALYSDDRSRAFIFPEAETTKRGRGVEEGCNYSRRNCKSNNSSVTLLRLMPYFNIRSKNGATLSFFSGNEPRSCGFSGHAARCEWLRQPAVTRCGRGTRQSRPAYLPYAFRAIGDGEKRKVRRACQPSHVHVCRAVDRNPVARVFARLANIRSGTG